MLLTPQEKAAQSREDILAALIRGAELDAVLEEVKVRKAAYYSYRTKHRDWAKEIDKLLYARKPFVEALVERRMARAAMTPEQVLEKLTDIASADWREYVQIRYGENGEIVNATLKLGDQLKALELLGKYHKMFTDKVEVKVDPIEIRVIEPYKDPLGDAEVQQLHEGAMDAEYTIIEPHEQTPPSHNG